MLNSCIIIGRIVRIPKLETNDAKTDFYVIIETDRPFRSEDGTVEKDTMSIRLWRGLAAECCDVCHVGDIIAVNGRIETTIRRNGNKDEYLCQIVAERLTFLMVGGKRSGAMF